MNEVLGKRLLGAFALVAATLTLANLLPEPQALPPADKAAKRMSYDLRPAAAPPERIQSAPPPVAVAAAPAAVQAPPTTSPAPAPAVMTPSTAKSASTPPRPKPAPAAKRPPPPKQVAEPKIEPAVPQPAEQKPATVASEVTAAPAAPVPAPPTPAIAAPKPAIWYVQIGAFSREVNAQNSVRKLQQAGMEARQDTVDGKLGRRYRVRCGPFPSRDDAETERVRAAKLGFGDARLAQEPSG